MHSLSEGSQSKIDKEILLSMCRDEITSIDEGLYQDLTHLRRYALTDFMFTNYKVNITLKEFDKDPDLLIYKTTTSYRIQSSHLTKNTKFPLRLQYKNEYTEKQPGWKGRFFAGVSYEGRLTIIWPR